MFGANTACVKEGRTVTCQTLSGTGALRVGFEFIQAHFPCTIYVSNPSWGRDFMFNSKETTTQSSNRQTCHWLNTLITTQKPEDSTSREWLRP